MKLRRIAITGGPGTGKTALVKALEKKGYACFHEYSRQIIRESLEQRSDVLPWKDLPAFSERVWDGRLKQHQSAKNNEVYFYDRTLVDIMAYCEADGFPIPELWENQAAEHRYETGVYITPPWRDIYVQDEERQEHFEHLIHLHEHLKQTYDRFGYKMIEVPKVSVEERVNWLIQQL